MYVVVVEFITHAEHYEQFVDRVCRQAEDSLRLETNCHVFDVCVSPLQPNLVLLYEVYSDKKAFDAHLDSAHFHDFNTAVQQWVSDKKVSTYTRK